MRRPLRIALVGFGHVGRRFAERLGGPYARALRAEGVEPVVTGIATGRHGLAVDADGLSVRRALALVRAGRSLAALHRGPALPSVAAFVRRVPADVVVELTPLDPRRGQPAIDHVRAALRRGLHVVTANKGPVAFAHERLKRLAARRGRRSSTNRRSWTALRLQPGRALPSRRAGRRPGTLNSTTSLSDPDGGGSEPGCRGSRSAAWACGGGPCQRPDGWDAAVKGCALARVLLGAHHPRARPPARHPRPSPRRPSGPRGAALWRVAARSWDGEARRSGSWPPATRRAGPAATCPRPGDGPRG